MYQWKETKKEETKEEMGGGTTTTTTYDYSREWSDDPINSSDFKYPDGHHNPAMPFSSKRFAASDAQLVGWKLDAGTLDRVSYAQALTPTAPAGWTLSDDNYYRGDAAAPKVGDMRVRYVGLPSGTTISVLAMESGDGFAVFTTKNGYEVELAAVGDRSAAELIENKRKSEAILTWILRGVGTLPRSPRFDAAIGEAATGLALLIVPSLVVHLLLGQDLAGVAVPVARVAGIALVGLGISLWPGPPLLGMLIYSTAVTLYLAYLGLGGLSGLLLWPAVVLHATLSVILGRGCLIGATEGETS